MYWATETINSAIRLYYEAQHGGHFAALEEPELLAADIRAFFRPLRRANVG